MIKIQNNTATRDPLPQFLQGLSPESLADLSWTDASLGVQDCAWYEELNGDEPINHETHKYGAETLTINHDSKTVTVTHEILPLSQSELDAIAESKKQAQKQQIEQDFKAFLDLKDIESIGESSVILNSTNPTWQNEAQKAIELWDLTWQAFYDNKPLPKLEW